MKLWNAIAGLMLFGAIGIAQGQEPAAKSTSSGVFSNEQAKRDEAAYNANCVTCHGAELRSPDRSPSLRQIIQVRLDRENHCGKV